MKTLTTIAGKMLRNKFHNDNILQICGVMDVVPWSRQHTKRNHIKRMESLNCTWRTTIGQWPTEKSVKIWRNSWQYIDILRGKNRSIDLKKWRRRNLFNPVEDIYSNLSLMLINHSSIYFYITRKYKEVLAKFYEC